MTLLDEIFVTEVTLVLPDASVTLHVTQQMLGVGKRLLAAVAGEFLFAGVDDDVLLQTVAVGEALGAVLALVGPLSAVQPRVFVQCGGLTKSSITHRTSVKI